MQAERIIDWNLFITHLRNLRGQKNSNYNRLGLELGRNLDGFPPNMHRVIPSWRGHQANGVGVVPKPSLHCPVYDAFKPKFFPNDTNHGRFLGRFERLTDFCNGQLR